MSKQNILVVDDEREITDAIEIYLTNEGFNVFKAYDGLEALEVLDREEELFIRVSIKRLSDKQSQYA